MADSCADGDEDLSNEEETIRENLPGTGQISKQSLKLNPQRWECECAAIRIFFCFLILCVVMLQSYMDYRAFQRLEFSEDDYEELLPFGSPCSPNTIFVWPSKGHGDVWVWEPTDRTLRVNTTLFVR